MALLLFVVSIASLFVGATDIRLGAMLADPKGIELKIFLLARIPRLLAILCTGVGMSVAGLIMQQLCMNKFVSPSTGATIQSAQFGIMLALVFVPGVGLWGRVMLAFAIGSASIIFQSIINNRIVTPCLLDMNSMYTLVHTAVVFAAGSGSVLATNSNLSFAVDLIIMVVAATFV